MNLILFVLHDPKKLLDLLAEWQEAGISGATVLGSTGLGRLKPKEGLLDDIPLMPSLEDFYSDPDQLSRTIFTLVDDSEVLDKVIAATQRVVGDLTQPDQGLLMVLPVSQVHGLRKGAYSK